MDDYGFISDVDNEGAGGLMRNSYLQWQSRFSGFYILGWILKIWGHASNLIGYTILMLLLGYVTFHYALRNMTKLCHSWLLWGGTIIVTNISIMAYFEMSTFYWVCCALYTLSTYAAIALITAIFFDKGKLWARWLVVVISSLYICGGAENFTPIVIATLGIILLYQMWASRTWVFWKTQEQRMMLVSLAILMIGFVAVISGPGTRARIANSENNVMSEHFAIVPYMVQLAKASAIFYMRLLSRGLYYVLLFPVGMLIGKALRETGFMLNVKPSKAVILSSIAALFAIELSVAASVFGMGWYAPLRAYCFVSFIAAALVIYWGVLAGVSAKNSHVIGWCAVFVHLVIAGMSINFYKTDQPMVADVHQQIKDMYVQIRTYQESGKTEPLVLDPIQYPYVPNTYAILRNTMNRIRGKSAAHVSEPAEFFPYVPLTLSSDPRDFRNNGIRQWSKANFDLVVDEN